MNKLYLVFGGRVKDPRGIDFVDLAQIDMVGFFTDRGAAESAWRSAAQRTVDDAEMKYVVANMHELWQPAER